MSNYEVDQYLKKLPGFVDTKGRDQYKGKIKPTACGVVNMDVSTGPGTHFTCFHSAPDREHISYFDSYGAVPPEEIQKYLLSSGKTIAWNTTQYQEIGSSLCGYYCIKVLRELAKGKSFNDVLMEFSYNPEENENTLIKEFHL